MGDVTAEEKKKFSTRLKRDIIKGNRIVKRPGCRGGFISGFVVRSYIWQFDKLNLVY